MTEPVVIRPATAADVPAIIAVATATWEPTYGAILSPAQLAYMVDRIYAPDALRQQLTEHTFVLALEDNQPVGFASFAPLPAEAGAWQLHKIYLLPNQQGRGLGRRLVAEVTARVRAAGDHALYLNVNRHNPARQFYEKLGFAVVREEDVPIGPYWMNDYVMRLPIDP